MAYFNSQGRELGQITQAQAGILGRMPPQASVNGIGRMPPQASVNGVLGMLPPQAAAGLGQAAETTPAAVPGTSVEPLSPALPGGSRAFRDGIFGRRSPEEFGESLRPWRDGVFGPSLGLRGLGQANGPSLNMSDAAVTEELTMLLAFLTSDAAPVSTVWSKEHSDALVGHALVLADQMTGVDPAVFTQAARDLAYPTGAWVAMGYGLMLSSPAEKPPLGIITDWATRCSAAAPVSGERSMPMSEQLAAVNASCRVVPPGDGGPMRASTVAILGLGAAAVGIGIVAMSGKKRRRKRRRRRR